MRYSSFSRFSFGLTIFLLVFTSKASVGFENSILISNAWVKEAPPGVKVLAAYLTLENQGEHAVKLEKIESPQFSKIELHQTIIENDVASMEQQSDLAIEARSQVQFKPGGLHLMLFEPETLIKQGDEIKLELYFSDNTSQNIMAIVKRVTGKETDHSHHHHH